MNSNLRWSTLIALVALSACVSNSVVIRDEKTREFAASPEGRVYADALASLETTHAQRGLASDSMRDLKTAQDRGANEVAVYSESKAIRYVATSDNSFAIVSEKDTAEIEKLRKFLLEKIADHPADVRLTSVLNTGKRVTVRFGQIVARHATAKSGYVIPIAASGFTAQIEEGRLTAVQSTLLNPPSVSFVWKNPGFDLSGFSENEFSVLLKEINNSASPEKLAAEITTLSRSSGVAFDFAAFKSADAKTQRQKLTDFFAQLGPISTFKVMIDLAKKERLALSRGSQTWFFEVTNFLDLPLSFDIEIPRDASEKLKAVHLRSLKQTVAIKIFDLPKYPGTGTLLLSVPDERSAVGNGAGSGTARIFQGIQNYFQVKHNWYNYSGKDPGGKLDVFINVADPVEDADNAAWLSGPNIIKIGKGGRILQAQDQDISMLGHEFAHGIVSSSSRLVYSGQSGALNEHFADIQGAMIEATLTGRPYSYLFGATSLNPVAKQPRQVLMGLILPTLKLRPDEIARYNYNSVVLRHLMLPSLSFTTSLGSMDEGNKAYGFDCRSSDDNDHCGVHSMSGIPNRAVSILIDRLGMEKVRPMVFNTVTTRLGFRSNFQEYVRQLYEECLVTPGVDAGNDCQNVISAFEQVGVDYPRRDPRPDDPDTTPTRPPLPQPDPIQPPPPRQQNEPQSSPLLKMCGWVSVSASQNVTIIDNKYDTVALVKGYKDLTKGAFRDLYGWKCACAQGRISQTQNSRGVWFNYFSEIVATQERPKEACKPIVFK